MVLLGKEYIIMAAIRPYLNSDSLGVQRNLELAGMYDEVADSQDNLAAMIAVNPNAVLVAEQDNEIVGSIYTTPFGVNVTCIWRLAVLEHDRNQGVGSQLLKAVGDLAINQGVKEIWGFIDVGDEPLSEFYKNRGYIFNPDRRYYGIWKDLQAKEAA